MDKAARLRWTILLCGLIGTLVAIFYPSDDDTPYAARKVAAAVRKTTGAAAPTMAGVNAGDDADAGDPDPFAPRGWQAPPPPPAAATPQVAAIVAPVVPVEPTGPPPLPFRFVGGMTDGADQMVYLGRGDDALVARVGDVLEHTYKVTSITATQIEFEHMPTGQKQALALPARDN